MAPHIFYSDDRYEIRPAEAVEEFKHVWWQLIQELGWNRSYYDIESYIKPSLSSGMLLLIDKSKGAPVGHISAVVNTNETAWISMFIIQADVRGNGLGRKLFEAAMVDAQRAGAKILGLDAVESQKAAYKRRGFAECNASTISVMIRPLLEIQPLLSFQNSARSNEHLLDIKNVPRHLLIQHELAVTGFERRNLWSDEHMFNRIDVSGYALVNVPEPSSVADLQAWVLVRRSRDGFNFGPLYATNPQSAKAVLLEAMKRSTVDIINAQHLPHEQPNSSPHFAAEVWAGNGDAVQTFRDLGWVTTGVDYYRMWLDGKATTQQSDEGAARKNYFAIFDVG